MPSRRRDPEVAERFGENLRRVRRREGLSQEKLARPAGLHPNEIGRLENGERVPKIDTLVRLADSLVVPPAELLDGIYWVPAPEAIGTFTFSGHSGISRHGPRQEEGRRARPDI